MGVFTKVCLPRSLLNTLEKFSSLIQKKMKNSYIIPFALLAILIFSLSSCIEDSCEREVTYTQLVPVYLKATEIHRIQVGNEAPRDLCEPGKIYYYNDYLFINEGREGVHVIDNSDRSNPINRTFISIPGSEDIAIKDGRLLANCYTDLLSIDIDDIYNVKLLTRTENVFPPIQTTNDDRVLVYYNTEEITEVLDCNDINRLKNSSLIFFIDAEMSGAAYNNQGNQTGIAGSMARFSIVGDYLYVVDNTSLYVFNLDNGLATLANTVNLGWGIETIIPYEDKLFIGSNSGMFIFDNSNPIHPVMLSSFSHARACDPVFVKDNYAYVTLRSGNACSGFTNQLDLIDITDLMNPQLIESFPMDNPHGLSIHGDHLFLCEGASGLKSFDISDPTQLDDNLLDKIGGFDAFDVIALPGDELNLLVIGEDGFYQFNADNPAALSLISTLRKKSCE